MDLHDSNNRRNNNCIQSRSWKHKGKENLENKIIDGRMILKFFLLKQGIRIYAGYVWEQGPVVDFVSAKMDISIYQKKKTSRKIIRTPC